MLCWMHRLAVVGAFGCIPLAMPPAAAAVSTATHEALNESFDTPLGAEWTGPTVTANTTATWLLATNETGDSILKVEALSNSNAAESNYDPVEWGNEVSWSYDLGILDHGDFYAEVHFDWSHKTTSGSHLTFAYLYLVMELLDENDATFAKVGVFDGSNTQSPTYVGAYEEAGSYNESRGGAGLYDYAPDLTKFSISREAGNLQVSRYVENAPTAILASTGNTTGLASVRVTMGNHTGFGGNYWTASDNNVWAAVEKLQVMTTEPVIPEPTTALLLTLGLAGLGMRRRVR